MRFLCKFFEKYLVVRGKVRTFAPVQWNEGLLESPSFYFNNV